MENWRRAGFGNEHVFRFCRTGNAVALLEAARAGLREADYPMAARAVTKALGAVQEAHRLAKMEAEAARQPLNTGWPDPPKLKT